MFVQIVFPGDFDLIKHMGVLTAGLLFPVISKSKEIVKICSILESPGTINEKKLLSGQVILNEDHRIGNSIKHLLLLVDSFG